ncbi:hypothetical protein C0R09_08220 [Brevibacillus laterosporus]|uniref:hypothetical protein n=1 Tax=Brevibacillus laterosporus TaxID=1465 RepID=UPI000C7597EA|nr:hypothetical protein [Brevibacillus laterosporus]AUM64514.1 hypothetical protein C0R09_08220 [Brevibacillus laterosporus]
MVKKYVVIDQINVMEEDGLTIVVHNKTGDIMQVSEKIVEMLDYLKVPKDTEEIKDYLIERVSETVKIEEITSDLLNLLEERRLVKMIET